MRLKNILVFHHKYFADFYVTLTVNNIWTQDVMTTSVGVILNNAAPADCWLTGKWSTVKTFEGPTLVRVPCSG